MGDAGVSSTCLTDQTQCDSLYERRRPFGKQREQTLDIAAAKCCVSILHDLDILCTPIEIPRFQNLSPNRGGCTHRFLCLFPASIGSKTRLPHTYSRGRRKKLCKSVSGLKQMVS
jgi:hypothetical protein